MQKLFEFHSPSGHERCGVILANGDVLEIENVHPNPADGFAMPVEVLNVKEVVATWHTHPRTGPNLSVADYRAFQGFPRLRHYVVAAREIWCYGMAGDILVQCETIHLGTHDSHRPARPSQGPLPK